MAFFQKAMTFACFIQTQNSADIGLELAFVCEFRGLGQDTAVTFGSNTVDARCAHEFKDQGGAQAKKFLWDSVGRRANARYQPAIGSKTVAPANEVAASIYHAKLAR